MTRWNATFHWLTCASALFVGAGASASANAPMPSCRQRVEGARMGAPARLVIPAGGSAETTAALPLGHRVLILATEQRVDLLLEAGAEGQTPAVRADTPYRRQGTIHAIFRALNDDRLRVKLSVKEHPLATGTATIELFDLDSAPALASCATLFEMMAAGDADYSIGVDIATGRRPHGEMRSKHAYLRAAEEYLAAFNAASMTGDLRYQALAALARSATFYLGVKDWPRTAEWGARARSAASSLGDPYLTARAAYFDAVGWLDAPGPPVAAKNSGVLDAHTRLTWVREELSEVAAFHRRRGETYDSAMALSAIGSAYGAEGEYALSLQFAARTARMYHELREGPREGGALQAVAWNEWGLGDVVSAERHYNQALELSRPDVYAYAYNLAGLGNLEQVLGHLDVALRMQSDALRLAEKLQFRVLIGRNLYSLGATYYALGDLEQSIDYLQQATAASLSEPRSKFIDLRALSAAYRDAGRINDARAAAQQALALAYAEPSRARIEVAIATDDADLGDLNVALDRLDAVLSSRSMRIQDIHAEALIARARTRRLAGRNDDAMSDLTDALAVLGTIEAPADEFQANLEAARARLAQHRLHEADAFANKALSLAQVLRRQTANPELRAQRQEPLRPAYEVKIATLMAIRREKLQDGDSLAARAMEREALIAADASRAQALQDFSTLEFGRTASSALNDDLRLRSELYQKIGAKLDQLDYRTDAGDSDPRISQARAQLSALRRELDSVNATIAADAGRAGMRRAPDPIAWQQWLARHAPNAAIVEYWLGDASAYCWVVDRDGLKFFDLGPSAAIDAAARVLHAAMRSATAIPMSRRIDAAAALSELVFRPLQGALAERRLLLIVPDQALAYVPFSALVTSRGPSARFLVETHDIETAPAAWWLFRGAGSHRNAAGARILVVADPVYEATDERLATHVLEHPTGAGAPSSRVAALTRLPFTLEEADAISRQFPSGEVRRLQGVTATRSRFLAEPLGSYQFIHVASHGLVDSRMPQMASLVLSEYDDGGSIAEPAIRAADLMALELHADVVAFSACETALGRQAVGEGSMGLGYAALARGAHSVLMSLWSVSDEISAEVMTGFYGAIRNQHASPAAALALAMRGVLKKRPALDPALWAAYQLTLGVPPVPVLGQATAD